MVAEPIVRAILSPQRATGFVEEQGACRMVPRQGSFEHPDIILAKGEPWILFGSTARALNQVYLAFRACPDVGDLRFGHEVGRKRGDRLRSSGPSRCNADVVDPRALVPSGATEAARQRIEDPAAQSFTCVGQCNHDAEGRSPCGEIAGAVDRVTWAQQFDAMFLNQIELTAHLAKGMTGRRWGRIVSIASTSVQEPIPGLVYSNALRAGLQGYLKSLSDEVAAQGVTVNTVAPGSFATERTHSLDAAAAQRSGRSHADIAAEGAAGIPARRYGEPAEFGAMVAFLCSQASSYTTGAFFRVDGGSSRGGV